MFLPYRIRWKLFYLLGMKIISHVAKVLVAVLVSAEADIDLWCFVRPVLCGYILVTMSTVVDSKHYFVSKANEQNLEVFMPVFEELEIACVADFASYSEYNAVTGANVDSLKNGLFKDIADTVKTLNLKRKSEHLSEMPEPKMHKIKRFYEDCFVMRHAALTSAATGDPLKKAKVPAEEINARKKELETTHSATMTLDGERDISKGFLEFCMQLYNTNSIEYIGLDRCTKRAQETVGKTKNDCWQKDEGGYWYHIESDIEPVNTFSTQLEFSNSMERRGLGMSAAQLVGWQNHEKLRLRYVDAMTKKPIDGFRRVTTQQCLYADKILFDYLDKHYGGSLKVESDGTRPLDKIWEAAIGHEDFRLAMQPKPDDGSSRSQPSGANVKSTAIVPHTDNGMVKQLENTIKQLKDRIADQGKKASDKGYKGKGKGKRTRGNGKEKNKSSKGAAVPTDLIKAGAPKTVNDVYGVVCYHFNRQTGCLQEQWEENGYTRCQHGLHVCLMKVGNGICGEQHGIHQHQT